MSEEKMIYLFQIKHSECTHKVSTLSGEVICFVDEHPHTPEQVFGAMHSSYEQGVRDGKRLKSESIRKILGV